VKPTPTAPTTRTILLFWAPLALQWMFMAAEGPFLAAIIARMGDPALNLAAYGVAFALAILVESPVIMLMSAATALVEDATSYRRLRNFTHALNAGSTALLVLLLVPPIYAFLMTTMLGLPAAVVDRVYIALWLLLPWPAAIGYRRFLHGVLIRSGLTRRVAYGTLIRLAAMSATGLGLFLWTRLPGAWVGAAALSAGVCAEAVAARVMARHAIRELLAQPGNGDGLLLGYRDIGRFYFPLALTSFIALTVQPVLTFFMGRAPLPVESLAVFPVVHALSFLFRAPGFAYQETVIALVGRGFENSRPLGRFGYGLALVLSGGFAVVAFSPLATFWFETVSGLPADLGALATTTARIMAPMPAVAVMLAFQHAILVKARTTRPITLATALEVATVAATFGVLGWSLQWTGVLAAAAALVTGRLIANAFLLRWSRRTLVSAGAKRAIPPPR
jgi:progressive ankylosis protein